MSETALGLPTRLAADGNALDVGLEGTIKPNLPTLVVPTFEDIYQKAIWEVIRSDELKLCSEVGR